MIQGYNTTTYPDPLLIPALIIPARIPGVAAAWKQPTNQYDAYKLLDHFTGLPDRCTYQGKTWVVTLADGAGNNIWAPGAYGWAEVQD